MGHWPSLSRESNLRLLVYSPPEALLRMLLIQHVSRFDPSGFIVEHYADGDLVNSETPATRELATKKSLYAWGPEVPKAFFSADIEFFKKAPVVEGGAASAGA